MTRRELTERERAMVQLISQGLSNAEIAAILGVSMATVKRHVANVMIKWDVTNRTQIAVRALRHEVEPSALSA